MTKKLLHILVLILVITNWGTPVLMGASRSTVFPVAPKKLSQFGQFVPDSLTSVTTTDTYLFQLQVTNDCASSVTLKITDNAASPKIVVSDRSSVTSGQTVLFVWPEGLALKSGMKWQAGTASCLSAFVSGTYI